VRTVVTAGRVHGAADWALANIVPAAARLSITGVVPRSYP
jgi:hypothetical protein